MNALSPHAPERPPASPATISADAGRAARLVDRLGALYAGLTLLLLAAAAFAPGWGGLGVVCAASLLLPTAGLLAAGPLCAARVRLREVAIASGSNALRWPHLLRRLQQVRMGYDPAAQLARLARRPQGIIVPAIGFGAIALVIGLRSQGVLASGTMPPLAMAAAAIVLGFPLLLAERVMAAASLAALPEGPALRALLFVPALLVPLAGLLSIAAGMGLWWARIGLGGVALYVGLVALELSLRGLANWFLPPPEPMAARAAVGSLTALLLQPGRLAPDGVATPIRVHLGLDFSRSWGLRYARSAALPIGLALGLIAWLLSGITLIDLDRRGIYERFGEPAAVWQPGVHAGLPWPLGRVRTVDLGAVHAVLLGDSDVASVRLRVPAETASVPSADRLWDQVHPSEVSYLLASRESDGRQGFQAVSVDLRVLYRVGLDDASALRSAYAIAAPDELVRAEAGRLLARVFAGDTLADVLGAGRETLGDTLRAQLQAELDRLGSGLELSAMVIEAIHPPPDAAEAYHNVQAAEIVANTAISTERGRALASAARARQQTAELVAVASGTAAETVGQAEVSARTFAADRGAAQAGGAAFLLERYLLNVSAALNRAPLVIVDHRLAGPDAPAIDLRGFGAPPTRAAGED